MIANRLKIARKDKGLTQKELGVKLGVENTTISNYESGHSMPDANILVKLSEVLDVSTDYLLGRTDNKEGLKTKKVSFKEIPELAHLEGYLDIMEDAHHRDIDPSDIRKILDILDLKNKQ